MAGAAERLGLRVVWLEGDWRHGASPERIADALDDDVRAVMVVHNETSTLKDQVFRIGHLGDFNDLMLAGTLSGMQMGLQVAGHDVGDGVGAALEVLKT